MSVLEIMSEFNAVSFVVIGFILFIIVVLIGSVISNKKNGIKVKAKINSIEKRVNADGYPECVILCSCPYENVDEARLFYNFKFDLENVKVGDEIDCIYNKKKNFFTTSDNLTGIIIMIVVLVVVVLFIAANFLLNIFMNSFVS